MQNRNLFFIIITTVLIAVGSGSCGEKRLAPELVSIGTLADGISAVDSEADRKRWREADSLLRSTDTSRLPENDRMYHSLLRVKVTDKAYLPHSGDTIIRPVVEYAEKHPRCGFYPEALYYAGRVYSDMGDSYTALSYFQKALDNLPEREKNTLLHGKILSQTASLLHSLRLHEEAAGYVKESIRVDSILGEDLLILFNTELLASIYKHLENYGLAKKALESARRLAQKIAPVDTAIIDVNLAEILYHQGKITDALNLIRPAVEATDSLSKNLALANAARIYKEAGIPDTAALYALKLVNRRDPSNHKIGYRVIFSKELGEFIPSDTLVHYIRKYHTWMESYLDRNGDTRAISQQSLYNYRIQEKKRRESEERISILRRVVMALTVFFILVGGGTIYYFISKLRFRKGENIALNNQLERICSAISLTERPNRRNNRDEHPDSHSGEIISTESEIVGEAPAERFNHDVSSMIGYLRNDLINSLCAEIECPDFRTEIDISVVQSEVYKKLRDILSSKEGIGDNSPIWEDLRKTVLISSPKFDSKLDLILEEPPELMIRRVAYLIKFGFSNNEIASLINKAPSSASRYRSIMCEKIFGDKTRYQDLGKLISIL